MPKCLHAIQNTRLDRRESCHGPGQPQPWDKTVILQPSPNFMIDQPQSLINRQEPEPSRNRKERNGKERNWRKEGKEGKGRKGRRGFYFFYCIFHEDWKNWGLRIENLKHWNRRWRWVRMRMKCDEFIFKGSFLFSHFHFLFLFCSQSKTWHCSALHNIKERRGGKQNQT